MSNLTSDAKPLLSDEETYGFSLYFVNYLSIMEHSRLRYNTDQKFDERCIPCVSLINHHPATLKSSSLIMRIETASAYCDKAHY